MTAGAHRSPRRKWAPAAVAGTVGGLVLSQAAVCAVAGWLGWWRYGDVAGLLLLELAIVLISWALGYATSQEDGSARPDQKGKRSGSASGQVGAGAPRAVRAVPGGEGSRVRELRNQRPAR